MNISLESLHSFFYIADALYDVGQVELWMVQKYIFDDMKKVGRVRLRNLL